MLQHSLGLVRGFSSNGFNVQTDEPAGRRLKMKTTSKTQNIPLAKQSVSTTKGI